MTEEEKELEDTLGEELDWLEIEEIENKSMYNKCLCPVFENDTLVETFITKKIGLNNKEEL